MDEHEDKHPLVPNGFELWCVGLAATGLLLVGNTKFLLERYGLVKSSQVIGQQVSHQVGSSLAVVDSFKATATLVTFTVWCVFGLTIFSAIYAVVHTIREFHEDQSIASDAYLHPAGFDRAGHRKRVAIDTIVLFTLLFSLIIATALYLLSVLPVGFTYVRHFLQQASLHTSLDLLAGIFMVFAGTLALYTLSKLVLRHYRTSRH